MNGHILVVEDEADIRRLLRVNLEREGHAVREAESGRAALEALQGETLPDLMLLDLMLPDINGTEVCRRLRAAPRTAGLPVIMVTARADEIDRVVGLAVGADDYVAKPFSVRELCLRVRALLRRATASGGPRPATLEGLTLTEAGGAVVVDGERRDLTPGECRVLTLLLSQPGRVFTRDALRARAWPDDVDVSLQAVDSSVKRLRRKLGPAGQHIEALRGVGYRLAPQGWDAA